MPTLACQPGEGGSFYLQRRQAVQGRAFYRHARQQGCQALQNMVVERPAAAYDQMLPGACAMAQQVLRYRHGGELSQGSLHIGRCCSWLPLRCP